MPKFRKRPVIEAIRILPSGSLSSTPPWILDAITHGKIIRYPGIDGFSIRTLEGVMGAPAGHWIIRGVAGELYPCHPDIFAETYEPVED